MKKNRKITILAITKYEGAGAATIARQLSHDYGYLHFSVRDYLTEKFIKEKKVKPSNQEELEAFGTKLCKEKISKVIAPILQKILASDEGDFFVIQSFLRPGELQYVIDVCSKLRRVNLKLVKLDAPTETRLARIRQQVTFKGDRTIEKLERVYVPVSVEYLNALQWIEECDTDPEKVNLFKCFEMIPDEGYFQNLDNKLIETTAAIHRYVLAV